MNTRVPAWVRAARGVEVDQLLTPASVQTFFAHHGYSAHHALDAHRTQVMGETGKQAVAYFAADYVCAAAAQFALKQRVRNHLDARRLRLMTEEATYGARVR